VHAYSHVDVKQNRKTFLYGFNTTVGFYVFALQLTKIENKLL